MKYVIFTSLFLFVSCGPTNHASDRCQTPSFTCSGGFYGLQSPSIPHSFSFEKWEAKLEKGTDTTSNEIVERFRYQKELGNFTILSMGYKTPTHIKNFTASPEYAQFLSFYSQAIQLGLVDYLNVGEETDFEVANTIADLRVRFPKQKFGSWPGRPLDLVRNSDFYLFDDYHATTREEFDFLFSTGKPIILVINATPGLVPIENSYFQIDLARELNIPIMFFAVSERNSALDYYGHGEIFTPYYQMVEDVTVEQGK